VANEGATLISALLAAHPQLVASARYHGDTPALSGQVNNAFLAGGPERERVSTEEGMVNSAVGVVRYLTSAEPAGWSSGAIIGQKVKVLYYGMSDWTVADVYRVTGRKEVAGAVRLTLMAEYE
jgi:hypothetical protein